MFINILLVLTFLSSLCSSSTSSSSSSIRSNNFCKLADRQCSQRSFPHIYQCGPVICTKSQTECKEYKSIENKIRPKGLTAFGREYYSDMNFRRFQGKIKNCSQIQYHWQSSDICIPGINCLQRKLNMLGSNIFIQFKIENCPCPTTKPYVCGEQRNLCSLNREACDSFSDTANKNKNSNSWIQLFNIKICENEFSLIK